MWTTALTYFALFSLSGAQAAQTIPFEFYGNAIWVEARVEGSRPLHFQFDTAAGACVLNRAVADELKLPIQSEYDAVAGSGGKSSRIAMLAPATVNFGGVPLQLSQWAALPLDEVARTYGTAIDGIMGYPLLERYVVRIDFDTRTLTLVEPAAFRADRQAVILPLEIDENRNPIVKAKLSLPGRGEIEGRFIVDEPYPGALLLATPFVRQQDLLPAASTLTPRMLPGSATGVGGKFQLQVGRVESFMLGPFVLKRPMAAFTTDARAGAFARTDIAGIMGGEILRRFKVTLDYSRRQIILEKGKSFEDPFESDASGISFEAMPGSFQEFRVTEVIPDSPATDSGVQNGDQIIAIDGQPDREWTVWKIRTLLRRAGRTHKLKLRRGEQTLNVKLKTRRLI